MQNFDEFKKILGQNIRWAREKRGLRQKQLATLVGLTPLAVGNIERGKSAPKLQSLYQIANILNVPMRILVEEVVCLQLHPNMSEIQVEEK